MKTDILVSGAIAVAIHALIFSLPVSKAKSNTRAHSYKPISISIIYSNKAVAALPPVHASAQALVKSTSELERDLSSSERTISRERITHKGAVVVKETTIIQRSPEEAIQPEPAPSQMPKDRSKRIKSTPSVKTASAGRHILKSGQGSIGISRENRTIQESIVYARPEYKENTPPDYPEVARRRGYEGRALLRVKVLENGKPGEIEIEGSSGFKVLDNAALSSVKGWTFVPGRINGKRTEQWIRVPIRFILK